MPVVQCSCGKKYRIADEHLGKKVRCQACGALVPVTGESASSSAVRPAAGSVAVARRADSSPPAERWFVYSHDGQQYGPVPHTELNEWVARGLVTPACQLIREGQTEWVPAGQVFPQLAAQPAFPAINTGAPAAKGSGGAAFPQFSFDSSPSASANEPDEDDDDSDYEPQLRSTGKKKTLANMVVSSELKQMSGATLVSSEVYGVGAQRSLMQRLKDSVVVGPVQESQLRVDSLQLFRFRDSLGEFAAVVAFDNGMVTPIEFLAQLPGRLSASVVLLKQSGGKVAMEAGAILGGPLGMLLKNVGTKVESVWAGCDGDVPPLAQALAGVPALSQGIRWEGSVGGGPMSTIYRLAWGVQAMPLDDDSFLLVAQGVPKQKMFGLDLGLPWFHAYRQQFAQFVQSQNATAGDFDLYDGSNWLCCAVEALKWIDV